MKLPGNCGAFLFYLGIDQLVDYCIWDAGAVSSSLTTQTLGDEAQMEVQQLCKLKVEGSRPFISTKLELGRSSSHRLRE